MWKEMKKLAPGDDTHLKITGDAVACLQVIFAADWYFVINENLSGRKYFLPLTDKPGIPVQISASGPDSDWENIDQAFLLQLPMPKKCLYCHALPDAARSTYFGHKNSGAKRCRCPDNHSRKIRCTYSKWCSFSYIEELLEAGVKIYFYEGGFIHSNMLSQMVFFLQLELPTSISEVLKPILK